MPPSEFKIQKLIEIDLHEIRRWLRIEALTLVLLLD